MKKISIVIPAFNEQNLIKIAYDTIKEHLTDIDMEHEFIFVDDGSKDSTFDEVEKLVKEGNTDVRGISFSRNFGK